MAHGNVGYVKSTKQLAWKLGLVKKRSKSSNDQAAKRLRRNFQPYAYLIIIDFESTCWEDKKYRTQEIIEFPAVLLNTGNGEIEEEFHYYVQPSENPILSEFCKNLTGITQAQVEEGIPIMNCLKRFNNWINKLKQTKNIIFAQPNGSRFDSSLCTFVTWSDWDLGVCLQYECRRKQLLKPAELNSWIDLRATYRKFYARKPEGLNGALKDLGIEFEGREHSGLHDSRNTARLAWRMMCDGCLLNVTKILPQAARARMPPMSAGIGTSNLRPNNEQVTDKPVPVLAKQNTSEQAATIPSVTTSSTISAPKITVAQTGQSISENANFTSIRPVTANSTSMPCSTSKHNPTGATNVVSKPQISCLPLQRHCSGTGKALPVATEANTAVTSITSGVHLSVGLARIGATKSSTFRQNVAKTMHEQGIKSTTVNVDSKSNALETTNDSPAVQNSTAPGRPSLGASPLLRSNGIAPKNKLTITSERTGFQNTVQSTAAAQQSFPRGNGFKTPNSTQGNNGITQTNRNNSNRKISNNSPQDFKLSTSIPQTSPDLFKIPTPPAPGGRSSDKGSKASTSFKVPTPPGSGRDSLGNMTRQSSGLSNRASGHQNLSNSSINTSMDMQRTPPMCECGRRTKRRVVQSPGANQGRAFYCCPIGRGTASTGDLSKKMKSGCKYFKWESSLCNSGNKSVNTSHYSFFNDTRNSMNSSSNNSWNSSKIGHFNRSTSWNNFNGKPSNYSRNQPARRHSEQFLGKPTCPNPGTNRQAFKSPDIIAMSPPDYRSPDLLNDSLSSLDQFPLLPPDAFSDPDKL